MDMWPSSHKAWDLIECYAAAVLKSFIIFEQEVLHFSFLVGPANYVVGPSQHSLVVGAECGLNFTKCARSQILPSHP